MEIGREGSPPHFFSRRESVVAPVPLEGVYLVESGHCRPSFATPTPVFGPLPNAYLATVRHRGVAT